VLGNLLANALAHTPPGGAITVGVEVTSGEVSIRVADDGVGIPAEELPHIFDRFWRGGGEEGGGWDRGSGLGLAIARQLVQAHGGRIWAESPVGDGSGAERGSAFTIALPVG
jgi:signal transduction histidine kinase